jgi:hypothetical protein
MTATEGPSTRTTPTDWPQQLRLPGQADAPEGPVDLFMMYLLHHAFRRDLAAFAAAVPRTPVEDRATWQALAARWELFAHTLHHHHSGEDTWLWPALLERAGDEDRETLEAMEAEHAGLDPLLQASAAGFATMAAHGDEDVRAALAVRLVAARESLGRHLAHEETDAMRILQARISPTDWQEIEPHFGEGVSFRDVLVMVPWVAHGIPVAQREDVFRRAGTANKVLWWATRRGFARREARAFRYAG